MSSSDRIHIAFEAPRELHERIELHKKLREDELMRRVPRNSIWIDAMREFLDRQEYDQE